MGARYLGCLGGLFGSLGGSSEPWESSGCSQGISNPSIGQASGHGLGDTICKYEALVASNLLNAKVYGVEYRHSVMKIIMIKDKTS